MTYQVLMVGTEEWSKAWGHFRLPHSNLATTRKTSRSRSVPLQAVGLDRPPGSGHVAVWLVCCRLGELVSQKEKVPPESDVSPEDVHLFS